MENKDNDIELLAGQVWNAPDSPFLVKIEVPHDVWRARRLEAQAAFDRDLEKMRQWIEGAQWSEEDIAALKAELRRTPYEFSRIQIVPQVEIVRHPIPPGMSENTHESPHYGDILPHKDKA